MGFPWAGFAALGTEGSAEDPLGQVEFSPGTANLGNASPSLLSQPAWSTLSGPGVLGQPQGVWLLPSRAGPGAAWSLLSVPSMSSGNSWSPSWPWESPLAPCRS